MREDGGVPPFGGFDSSMLLSRRTGTWFRWGLVLFVLVLLAVAVSTLKSIFTDWLWFNNLGYLTAFTTVLWARVWLFLAGAGLFGVLIAVNIFLVRRYAKGESVLPLPADAIRWLDRILVAAIILGALFLTLILGSGASSRWEVVLKLANATPFGVNDPVFHKDISFFVFTLPFLEAVQGWFLSILIVLLVVTGLMYLAYYTLRGLPMALTPPMRGHLAVLGGLIFLDLAVRHFLARYNLLFSPSGAVFGATYADITARMPAQVLLTAVAVACGGLLWATLLPALRGPRGTRLIFGAVALWVGAAILVGNLYPAFIQRFVVQPNELQRERLYIERNIAFTRAAFGLDRVQEKSISVQRELSAEPLNRNPDTVNNVRLWDPRPLKDAYNRAQFLRSYYNFKDADVDRYVVDGRYRQVMLSARELEQQGLRPEAQNWVNQHLQYTHGYGSVASPATEFTTEGQPTFFLKDVPPVATFEGMDLRRPEIYFGESSLPYAIVNSRTTELDYEPKEGSPVYKNYEGGGGVHLSSLLRRLAYAWQFGEMNLLVSDQITSESRIQYRRPIQERIHQVAPFLLLDRDPYLVIEDGRLKWIQDAYTVTNRYPYSARYKGTFNYMRNSVKAVVDAYEGSIEFYVVDSSDPVIRTYQSIFPSLFKPAAAMSSFLKAHVRYPEDLFSVQAELYLQYHMKDVNQFFNKADQWDVPEEIFFGNVQLILPYYVVMKLEGEERPEFVLILPFTLSPTKEKPNMVAWLAARMDQPHYGELLEYRFPRGVEIHGPSLVEGRIDQDFAIKQDFALLCSGEARCIRGNLLVIPLPFVTAQGQTEWSILYVEPLYLQSSTVPFPELKRVILASGTKVVMQPSLKTAVAALVGAPAAEPPKPPPGAPSPTTGVAERLDRVQKALQALKEGITTLEETLRELAKLVEEGKP